jgi:hypothetical protein
MISRDGSSAASGGLDYDDEPKWWASGIRRSPECGSETECFGEAAALLSCDLAGRVVIRSGI